MERVDPTKISASESAYISGTICQCDWPLTVCKHTLPDVVQEPIYMVTVDTIYELDFSCVTYNLVNANYIVLLNILFYLNEVCSYQIEF